MADPRRASWYPAPGRRRRSRATAQPSTVATSGPSDQRPRPAAAGSAGPGLAVKLRPAGEQQHEERAATHRLLDVEALDQVQDGATAVSTVASSQARYLPRRSARESTISSSPTAAAPVVAAAGKTSGTSSRRPCSRPRKAGSIALSRVIDADEPDDPRHPLGPRQRLPHESHQTT